MPLKTLKNQRVKDRPNIQIAALSKRYKELRIQISNKEILVKCTELKHNKIIRQIRKRLKKQREEQIKIDRYQQSIRFKKNVQSGEATQEKKAPDQSRICMQSITHALNQLRTTMLRMPKN